MKYVRPGKGGLEISGICAGCHAYATPGSSKRSWTSEEHSSPSILPNALKLGVDFINIANIYSIGTRLFHPRHSDFNAKSVSHKTSEP